MILYLHGFASGPSSFKARTLAARFAAAGVELETPDLTPGPDGFERSTPLTMLAVAEARLAAAGQAPVRTEPVETRTDHSGPVRPEPVEGRTAHALIGSSLGGYLSAVLASRNPSVERLVLLAPAFHLFARWRERLTAAQLEDWRRNGLETRHHVTGTMRRIGWAFHEDARALPELPVVRVPTLVLAGTRDEVIPIADVRDWVARTPTARLVELDDGHELVASIDRIWEEARGFLGV